MKKGLLVDVYRNPNGDCTANGLSSKCSSLLLVGDNVDGPFYIDDEDNGDYLVCIHRERHRDFIAVPNKILASGDSYMFGGNFIYTSDSRFPSNAPIKIFDRVERKR